MARPKKAPATPAASNTELVLEMRRERADFLIVGDSPLVYNAMSFKSKTQLLMPGAPKNAHERRTTLKHIPILEYRDSVYRDLSPTGPTLLNFPAAAFKKALASSALDMEGATKSEIGRLVWCEGDRVAIYGVPQIFMAVVRSADMARTPDVRTRAIVPEWAARVSFSYTAPKVSGRLVASLLASAGMTRGIGDFRQEKGAGNYGRFRCVAEGDPEFERIVAAGGRAQQAPALMAVSPESYDSETSQLLGWLATELGKRGLSFDGTPLAGSSATIEDAPDLTPGNGAAAGLKELVEDARE